jgi:long-chain acyl-CoA synthetase
MAAIADTGHRIARMDSECIHCRQIADSSVSWAAHPGEAPESGEPSSLWSAFIRSASLHFHRTALACDDETASYAQLHQSAQVLAAGLIEACMLEIGERVALLAGNRPEWLTVSLAVQGAGAVEVPCRPDMALAELLALLRRLDVVVAVVPEAGLALALTQHGAELPSLRRVIVLEPDSRQSGAVPLAAVRQRGVDALLVDAGLLQRRQWRVQPGSVAAIIHTSGTTGEPKAVLLSQQNLLHTQQHLPQELGLRAGERLLLSLPLWHLYGRLIAYVGLACGAALHFGSLDQVEQDLERIRPACFPAFPQIWEELHHRCIALLHEHWLGPLLLRGLRLHRYCLERRDFDRAAPKARPALQRLALVVLWLPSLLAAALLRFTVGRRLRFMPRLGIAGDAPLAPGIDADLQALGITVLQGYGSTEQLVSCMRRPGDNVPGTIGSPLPQVELRVLDRQLQPMAAGGVGQFAVSGPNVCPGYVDAALDRRSFFIDQGRRWFLTGDLGWGDGKGLFTFVGRLANVLSAQDGSDIFPELTENLLRESTAIDQVVIYPRRDGALGALVVPDAARTSQDRRQCLALLRSEILRLLRGSGLPRQQRPSHFVVARRALAIGKELTPTLKLKRRAIHVADVEETAL